MLTIYGRVTSYNVQKVLWLADELALDYHHVPAGGDHGGLNTPAFLTLNPNGKVPVVEDGNTVVWETHAILRYLAAQYGETDFYGDTPAARCWPDRWLDWSLSELEPAFFAGVFWGYYRTPKEQRDEVAIERALRRCHHLYALLATQLADQP